uniref:Uncharacterized protein n=1 Tax=uncultured prokaryote TaxID=198431 RepID=A0A0H5Q5E1_9ZZZZ|nr:hypothetical protein [uncultured prokaryote]
MKLNSFWAFGYADDDTHNSVLIKGNIIMGAICNAISAGDENTRSFATYILDGLFHFLEYNSAHTPQVNVLHKKFSDEVKGNLIPAMNDDEAGMYMLYQTLLDNGLSEEVELLGEFDAVQ